MARLLIYDVSERGFVGLTWKVGAFLFRWKFDKIIAAKDFEECIVELKNLQEKYDEVQFWGHGSPGFIFINKEPSLGEFWLTLAKVLTPNANVWLRVCSFAAGSVGKTMMSRISKTLNAKLMAYTYVIGTYACQSGLRVVTPKDPPKWSSSEGLNKTVTPIKFYSSAPWLPRTNSAFAMSPPKWALDKD